MGKYQWYKAAVWLPHMPKPKEGWMARKSIGFFSFYIYVYKARKNWVLRYEPEGQLITVTGLSEATEAFDWAEKNI